MDYAYYSLSLIIAYALVRYVTENTKIHLKFKGLWVHHWILAAIIPSLVPLLFASIGAGVVFSVFAGFMILQLAFVHFMMPESKGISLEELSKKLILQNET